MSAGRIASSAKKVYTALAMFLVVIAMGTVGYMALEGADPFAAFYMTIITVASVGYEEVFYLDTAGRAFTILVILAGLATWTFLTVTLVAFLVEGEFTKLFRETFIRQRIKKMRDHFIICGLGQTGRSALEEFVGTKVPLVVIEKDPMVAEEVLAQYPDIAVVTADATEDKSLDQAGVERARGLIAATESDANNLFIVLTARSKNRGMTITARATRRESFDKLIRAGANHVVMPNVIGGIRMASTLLRPSVVDFLDVMIRGTEEPLRMEQAKIPEKSPLAGKMLQEAAIPQKTGLLVLAVKHEDGEYTFNPTSTQALRSKDVLIVIGRSEQMPALHKMLGK